MVVAWDVTNWKSLRHLWALWCLDVCCRHCVQLYRYVQCISYNLIYGWACTCTAAPHHIEESSTSARVRACDFGPLYAAVQTVIDTRTVLLNVWTAILSFLMAYYGDVVISAGSSPTRSSLAFSFCPGSPEVSVGYWRCMVCNAGTLMMEFWQVIQNQF